MRQSIEAIMVMGCLQNFQLKLMSPPASDVLGVELLSKDARLDVVGEQGKPCHGGTLLVVPLFETVKDLRSAGSVIRELLSISCYKNHIIENHNRHQAVIFSQVGGGRDEYTDADIDGICEEWSCFRATFVFR